MEPGSRRVARPCWNRPERVLVTTRGSSGHLGPLVPFARACARAGHEVAVAAQRGHEAHVRRAGLAFEPVEDPPEDEWRPLLAWLAELDLETDDRVMIGELLAGIDLSAGLPGLRASTASASPSVPPPAPCRSGGPATTTRSCT
jgi:hypothetical protein